MKFVSYNLNSFLHLHTQLSKTAPKNNSAPFVFQ